MAPEDGDPTPKPSAAFAETVDHPPTPPPKLPTGTVGSVAIDATMAAPASGSLPPLPEVSTTLYQTAAEIARGGMGKIVAAEDRRLGRRVAIKQLLDPSGEQLTRFQREALITARLQHPGIVPVYEAGRWPSGEPFFAMKLVSGKPLDKVIAETNRLEDRLAVIPRLVAACDAIAYAHSQRIIHRDLKPGNVLLGDFGETVVIDWGLAKDLDAGESFESAARKPRQSRPSLSNDTGSSTLTVAGAVMGTPAYMAPEQARGESVDQRADVFALGAMLYHTLAGAPPYNARTATDVIAAAALGKVIPLRQRERRAPAELVAIVERAMQQEPHDRYPTAGELAHELRRFLTGQLVDAHRYTALQRTMRFVRKHQAAVTISLLAVTGFAVGGTLAVRRIVEARDVAQREQHVATTRREAAENLIDYMFSDMKKRLAEAGRLDMLAGIGTEVKRYYNTLSRIPGGMPVEDEVRMAEAIQLIGIAEHTSGKPDQALVTWREARERIAGVIGDDTSPRTRELRRMIARFDYEIGRIFQERGKLDTALEQFQLAQRGYELLLRADPNWKLALLDHADVHDRLGDLLRIDGRVDEAFEQYNEGKKERMHAARLGGGRVSDENLALSTSHFKLGSVYVNRGQSSVGLEEYGRALTLREDLLAAQPDNVVLQQAVLDVQRELGELQRQVGDEKAAIETFRRGLPVSAALVRQDPTNTDWVYQRANLLSELGFGLVDVGSYKEGLDHIEEAIRTHEDLVARDPRSTKYKVALSRSFTRAGDAHLYLGATTDGIRKYRAALDIRRELAALDPRSVAYRRSIAWSYVKLGKAFTIEGKERQALEAHDAAFLIREKLVAEAPSQGAFKNELAATEIELGRLLASKDPRRGDELIASGIARARMLVIGDALNNDWKETLTQGLIAKAASARDLEARGAALAEALTLAEAGAHRAPHNAFWPGYVADVRAALAEVAAARGDRKAAAEQWTRVREILESLEKDARLPAPRKPLLERARGRR